jgi:hypothetical protein
MAMRRTGRVMVYGETKEAVYKPEIEMVSVV